ncbi:MAG: hypothetical protein ACTSV2_13425 [Candidatus Thorarchaeota archaeon]
MVTELIPLKKFLNLFEKHCSEDSTQINVSLSGNTTTFLKILNEIIALKNAYPIISIEFAVSLEFTQHEDLLLVITIPMFTQLYIDPIPLLLRSELKNNSNIQIIQKLLDIADNQELCSPQEFFQLIDKDQQNLNNLGINWDIKVSFTKQPFCSILRDKHALIGIDSYVLLFFESKSFIEYMQKTRCFQLYEHFLTEPSRVIICIGDFDGTISNDYFTLTRLWDIHDCLDSIPFYDRAQLIKQDQIIQDVSPDSLGMKPIFPLVLEFDYIALTKESKEICLALESLEILYILLILSSHAVCEPDRNIWNISFIGSKTLQTEILFKNCELLINGKIIIANIRSLSALFNWCIDDYYKSRILMTRRTIALHSSSVMEFIENANDAYSSVIAAYDIYMNETITKILDIRLNFIENFQEWTNRDLDLRMRMQGLLGNTTVGGFGTLLGSTIGLISESLEPSFLSRSLLVIPALYLMYLLIVGFKIRAMDDEFDSYLAHHIRIVKYYSGILGSSVILDIIGVSKDNQLTEPLVGTQNDSSSPLLDVEKISGWLKGKYSNVKSRNMTLLYILAAIVFFVWIAMIASILASLSN